jgi:hypothetical protein
MAIKLGFTNLANINIIAPMSPLGREVTTMKQPMSLERAVEAFAGFMVLLSVALTYFVHPGFVWLTVFVGANLFQQAVSGPPRKCIPRRSP